MAEFDFYAMSDISVAEQIGQRLEQVRLEENIPQKQIAYELGISEGTYRSAVKGKGKLEVYIGILRVLGRLDELNQFLTPRPYSPMALLKLEGKKRQRAGRNLTSENDEGDSDW